VIKIETQIPKIKLEINVRRVSEEIGNEMRMHWANQLNKGLQSDGTPLPPNKKGLPLGRGKGTFVRKWRLRSSKKGETVVEVFRGGRYRHASWALLLRGWRPQGFGGPSGIKWQVVSNAVAKQAMEAGLDPKLARRKTIKVREWGV
jgi:hypothetical protein